MSRRLPDLVEPLALAERGAHLEGILDLARLTRLGRDLAHATGGVAVWLDFVRDEQGRPQVTGRIRATLALTCQRCLEPMEVPLDLEVGLGLLPSDADAQHLSPGIEPLLVGEEPVSLVQLVEDELLLALPAVPMHPPAVCRGTAALAAGAAPGRPDSPFAALEALRSGANKKSH
jgi:uncharacterized protein